MHIFNTLRYWFYHLTHLRTNEFMNFVNFLNRMDELNIYYIGGPEKLLQFSGRINDYHWYKFMNHPENRFFKAIKVVYSNDHIALTDRSISIQIMSEIFSRKEMDFLKHLIYSLGEKNSNFIKTDASSLNVAEAVSKYIHRIEGRMCTYTIK